ncbi:amidohydrolase family protein [Streptomyces sp.]|uniref:amidohydrolase family protein n=1 Tax=Streptomyces sp. TaxID=1931 RepID=UPI002F4156C2
MTDRPHGAPGAPTAAGAGFIDVHAHCLPEAYLAAAQRSGMAVFDGGYPIPSWSVDDALAFMDRQGIAAQVLSLASPPVHVVAGPERAVDLARAANEEIARIVDKRPDRFAATAVLPLPDVDAALAAIDHCYDELGVVGVTLFTHYGGRYLGDPVFEPVFAALNARRAVVLLHPTSPVCADETRLGRPAPVIEFPVDTTRAVADLLYAGTLLRHPDVRIVVPHAGAAVPALAWRIARFAGDMPMPGRAAGLTPATVMEHIRGLYYDIALSANQHALAALLTVTDPSHLLFGSDYPFAPEPVVRDNTAQFRVLPGLDDGSRDGIAGPNAARLFPALPGHREAFRPHHAGDDS